MIDTFLQRCDAYAARRGISRSRLSTLLFNDGKRLDALAAGSDVGVLTLERVEGLLSDMEAKLPEAAE